MVCETINTTDFSVPKQIGMVMERLEQAGFACYIVGGAVRDWLAGGKPHDYDLCTAAKPEQTEQIFSDLPVIETGLKHGTVTVVLDGEPIEITTFRTEGAYSDGRRPDSVAFVTDITRDLARRDFTVNAMAWSPQRGLCDPFGGKEDLQRKCIRCVGEAETRFQEDALRILRALRFAATRGYTVEPHTAQALHDNRQRLIHVSAERITAELLQLVCGAYAGAVCMEFADILTEILPELAPMLGFNQRNPHHKYDIWEHSVRAMEAIRPEPLLRLAMLFHDCGKPKTFSIDAQGIGHFYGHPAQSYVVAKQAMQHLRLSAQMEQQLLYLVRHHDTPLGQTARSVRRKLAVHGENVFRQLLAIKKADCIGQGTTPHNQTELLQTEQLLEETLQQDNCLTRRDLAVNGHDLQQWGVSGREIRFFLSEMLNRVLDEPENNTRERLRAIFDELREHQDRIELTVSGMSAGCCVREVRRRMERIPQVQKIDIVLDSGQIVLYGQKIPLEQVREALTAAGFEVVI